MDNYTATRDILTGTEDARYWYRRMLEARQLGLTARAYKSRDRAGERVTQAYRMLVRANIRNSRLANLLEQIDRECKGHPAGAFSTMGETVYCDGSCRGIQ